MTEVSFVFEMEEFFLDHLLLIYLCCCGMCG
jgi:hypothetical protein